MRKVFTGLATLLMLALVAQIFLAASGAFDTAPKEESFSMHRTLGYVIVLVAVVLVLLAALARMPGRIIGLTGLVAGLTILQPVIRALADAIDETGGDTSTASALVFGLHAVNALAIMGALGTVLRQSRALPDSKASEPVAGSAETTS